MKRIVTILIIAVIFGFFGCAKDPELPNDEMATVSFRSWVAKNAPNAIPLPTNDDVYIDFKYRNPVPYPDSLIPRLYSWFFVDYTGYTLDGQVFVTRSSKTAKRIGVWKNTTHFVKEFGQWYPDGGVWCKGLLEAFSIMHENDSARIYISSSMGYGKDTMACNVGTKGETSNYKTKPVYFDVRFTNSLISPSVWWLDSLVRFVKVAWGQDAKDSVLIGCYMNKLVENPSGYQIAKDSSVYVHYKHSFCDGHFINSNYDSVLKAEGQYNPLATYRPIRKKVGSTSDAYYEIYNEVLPFLRKGESAEFAIIAGWSPNGKEGNPMGIPQVLPWENTIFTVYTYPDSVWADSTNEDL